MGTGFEVSGAAPSNLQTPGSGERSNQFGIIPRAVHQLFEVIFLTEMNKYMKLAF